MWYHRRPLIALEDRGPLRVMFVLTEHAGGRGGDPAVELIRRMDRRAIPARVVLPEVTSAPWARRWPAKIPAFTGLLAQKYDFAVLLAAGAAVAPAADRRRGDGRHGGDKMFWGRLAAWLAGVPVICSALHSTGLPDRVELPNRLLAPADRRIHRRGRAARPLSGRA